MPNIASNAVYITGTEAQLDAIAAMCPGGKLDFQQVCPIPAAVLEEGTPGLVAAKCLRPFYQGEQTPDDCLRAYAEQCGLKTVPSLEDVEAQYPDLKALGDKQEWLNHNYGDADPIIWVCHEWGTKWNSIRGVMQRVSDSELRLWFDTAWAPPHGILVELTQKWGVTLKLAYTTEQGHCGLRKYTPEGPGAVWADLETEFRCESTEDEGSQETRAIKDTLSAMLAAQPDTQTRKAPAA